MSEIQASHTYYKRKIFRRIQKPEWAKRPAIHVQELKQENGGFRPATNYRPLNFLCLGGIKPIYSNASQCGTRSAKSPESPWRRGTARSPAIADRKLVHPSVEHLQMCA
ncbi:MAG: hypothetical protein RM368_23070 [Nostoc sp. DedSLP03]|uniref:hypothetical protein n=1 Tax=Nostoc sp. DedSLP03 TaxID=3075400 RepID=UPI002AD2A810|nr:hypothetical protein [Nostoc sp. DedSLP03]MDZ7967799.1 hypothetical protein [Nostoc sp. DedSLP03]